MRIYYQAGADGKIVNLDKPPYWMQTGDFLNYSWEYTLSGKCIGELRKTIQEKGFTITIFGKEQAEYERNVDALHEVFEKDVLKKKPGRFYFGEYYISCFIYASEKEEWESGYSMENTYLNTSHVLINLMLVLQNYKPMDYLNTSHVLINRGYFIKCHACFCHLNTSHVLINPCRAGVQSISA